MSTHNYLVAGRFTGQFNSCPHYSPDSGFWICGEGFAGWSWFEISFPDDGQCGVPDVSEDLRCAAAAHAAAVFGECHVADVEQPVLDMPMLSRDVEQFGWAMGTRFDDLGTQVQASLGYIRDTILNCNFSDPANSNNSLSDDLDRTRRAQIQAAATAAAAASSWGAVFEP